LTYLCRFIFLPIEYSYLNSFPFKDIENFNTVFSHELTHAFINSFIGYKHLEEIPDWFNESAAIFLGGDKKVKFSGSTLRTLSKDYSRYYDLFKFLKNEYTEESLYTLISRGIKSRNPDLHFTEVTGASDYNQYLNENYIKYYAKLVILGMIVLVILIILYKLIESAGYKINLISYILFILLVLITAWLVTGLIVMTMHTKIVLTLLIASLVFYSLIELKFYFKIHEVSKVIHETNALVELENSVFFCLNKYKYSSQKKREKLAVILQKTIHKMLLLYREKRNDVRCKSFYSSIKNYIESSPNLKSSHKLAAIIEKCNQFISENFQP